MAYEQCQYSVAVEMLMDEYYSTPNKKEQAYKAFLLGESYMKIGETDEAVDWFEISYNKGYGPQVTKSLAYSYKKQGKYRAAIEKYKVLSRQIPSREQEIKREISVCEQIAKWMPSEKYEYDIDALKLNSPDMEYGTTIYDDNYLVFTSDRKESTGGNLYKWTGGFHSDIYIAPKGSSKAHKFDAVINSKENEGVPCFSKDSKEIYFTRCFNVDESEDATCKIMYSYRENKLWSVPKVMPWTVDDVNYGHPALIESDSVMVFSANLGGTIGQHDLFYSIKSVENDGSYTWSEPEPMPVTINTPGEDLFPTGDGDTLYYSSDYLPGYGGLDIFKTYLNPNGTWAPPKNLRAPINSSEDDYGFVIDYDAKLKGKELQKGYFTSSRKGYGLDDIYSFTKKYVVPQKDTISKEAIDSSKYIFALVIQVTSPVYVEKENPNSKIEGYVPLANAEVNVMSNNKETNYQTDSNGIIVIDVDQDQIYNIVASRYGYLNDRSIVFTEVKEFPKDELSVTFNAKLTLNKIYYDTEIVLDKIYYDFNKWNIREDALGTLDTLSTMLQLNPQITIELSSHTDCRGDDDYNMVLSQKRAQAAVDYILSKGVQGQKIKARGYGETQPMVICPICEECTEDEFQQNRRTSFRIVR